MAQDLAWTIRFNGNTKIWCGVQLEYIVAQFWKVNKLFGFLNKKTFS